MRQTHTKKKNVPNTKKSWRKNTRPSTAAPRSRAATRRDYQVEITVRGFSPAGWHHCLSKPSPNPNLTLRFSRDFLADAFRRLPILMIVTPTV
jgi:hypothetical protein